jgi:hypothetical protein
MTTEHVRTGGPTLWFGLAGGIVAWLAHVSLMAAFTPYICHSGESWWYHALSAGLLAPTTAAFVWSFRHWRANGIHDGVGFLGAVGALVNVTMAVAIIAEWVPVFLLDACAR